MDTYEQEQADREQYWAEMQRLREQLDGSRRGTSGVSQPEQQKEDQK